MMPHTTGDVIATGRGAEVAAEDLAKAACAAAKRHGPHVVCQALRVDSDVVWEFLAALQGWVHAGDCEVAEAGARPPSALQGGGASVPVPSKALVLSEVEDLLNAIRRDTSIMARIGDVLTFGESWV